MEVTGKGRRGEGRNRGEQTKRYNSTKTIKRKKKAAILYQNIDKSDRKKIPINSSCQCSSFPTGKKREWK